MKKLIFILIVLMGFPCLHIHAQRPERNPDDLTKKLMNAISSKDLGMVRVALKAGANPNSYSWGGDRMLHLAAQSGTPEIAEALIKAGALIDGIDDNYGRTPAMSAAVYNNAAVLDCLIKNGANLKLADSSGQNALDITLSQNAAESVEVLKKAGMEVKGLSICDAIQSGREDLVREIIEKGVDLEKPDGSSEEIPLIQACYYGYPEIVTLLLEKKADVNGLGKKGLTALMVACDRGFMDIAEILLKNNPDLKKTTPKDRRTALMYAASSRNFSLVKLLIKAGADPDQEDADGRKASGYSWFESDIYKFLRALEKEKK